MEQNKRRVIRIDSNKCDGCGICATACHEGAIQIINGKARLIRVEHCDGLGDCLPVCPAGAIDLVDLESIDPKKPAVARIVKRQKKLPCGCSGTQARILRTGDDEQAPVSVGAISRLRQWPCQLRLIPANAPYLDNAALLIAADCTAYAYGHIHEDFMRGRITLIGCSKLDTDDQSQKLSQILCENHITAITVLRMEVPCCSGIERAVKSAVQSAPYRIPVEVVTITTNGRIIETTQE